MAKFVTIKTKKSAERAKRSGQIKGYKFSYGLMPESDGKLVLARWDKGVFVMPVSPNYLLSHQWIAEIERCYKHVPISAIYLEIPDETKVYYGHYAGYKQIATASEVSGYFYEKIESDEISSLLGFEVIIPCNSLTGITKVKHYIKRVGWRIYPKKMITNHDHYRRAYMTRWQYQRYLKQKYG